MGPFKDALRKKCDSGGHRAASVKWKQQRGWNVTTRNVNRSNDQREKNRKQLSQEEGEINCNTVEQQNQFNGTVSVPSNIVEPTVDKNK